MRATVRLPEKGSLISGDGIKNGTVEIGFQKLITSQFVMRAVNNRVGVSP